ncbi:hypothetical protein [Plantactinospora sp. GCM10030261]|uniref:HAAS signaling domain-containing protein n=1 Tax=Plantactinospora sp. GCM10030261 TaxID=3273420 RepID=UPI00360A59AA
MTVISGQEITEYVARVRAALADLSPEVRRELLEDLPEHLAEVGAENGGTLVERLGPPEAYAAELRAAAGLAEPTRKLTLDDRAAAALRSARIRLATLDRATGPLLGYARTSEFLRLLRPAWWVARGYLAVLVLAMLIGGDLGIVPRLGGSTVAAFPLLVAAVLGSIWLGRRGDRLSRAPRLVVGVAGGLIVLIGLAGLLGADGRATSGGYYTPSYNENPYTDVQDLYIYDSEGRLVDGARIFDQEGRPIQLGYPDWCGTATANAPEQFSRGPGPRYTYPYCPDYAPFGHAGPRVARTPPPAEPTTDGPAEPTTNAPAPGTTAGPGSTAAPGTTAPTPGSATGPTTEPTATSTP